MTDPGDTIEATPAPSNGEEADRSDHPDDDLLYRFVRGDATSEEGGRVVGHLLTGCPRCLRMSRSAWGTLGPSTLGPGLPLTLHPESYRDLGRNMPQLRRIAEELMDADRRRARLLCRELVSLPALERLPSVCKQDRFHNLHLVRLLEWEIHRRYRRQPAGGWALAEVAVAVAERLDPRVFGEALVADLQALAWGVLATCQRRCGDLDTAERSLAVAGALLRIGGGDPLERARWLFLRAVLRRDQLRHEDALGLLRRAEGVLGDLGDGHLLGMIRIEQGRLEGILGRRGAAADLLEEGLDLLVRERDPWLAFQAGVERGHHLLAVDRIPEATEQARRSRQLGETLEDPSVAPEVDRLEARVAAAAGRFDRAEELLAAARLGWLEQEAGGPALLATLDLAAVYLDAEAEKVRQLGEWAAGVFPSPGMGLDDQLAVFFLSCAGEEPGEYGGLLRHIAAHLERGQLQGR